MRRSRQQSIVKAARIYAIAAVRFLECRGRGSATSACWYELTGSGPQLVQIGGAVSAHEGYSTITPAMAEHFTVSDYDHRGYGQSDRPEGQSYGLDIWVDDLAGLLETIGIAGFTSTVARWVDSSRPASHRSTRSGSTDWLSAARLPSAIA